MDVYSFRATWLWMSPTTDGDFAVIGEWFASQSHTTTFMIYENVGRIRKSANQYIFANKKQRQFHWGAGFHIDRCDVTRLRQYIYRPIIV